MKSKKIAIISSIVIIWILVSTYALFEWTSSNNTNVSFSINGMSVTYNGGDNISNIKLLPVTDRAAGVAAGIAIEKTITAQASSANVFMNLYLDINSIDTGLKNETFKWEVVKGNSSLGSGNFANVSVGDTITLFSDEELTTTQSTYKLYIWIDGNTDNPEEMENKSFEFVLHADATNERPPTAAEKIISLSQGDTYTSGNGNGVYATNSYTDGGQTKYHEYRYVGGEVNNYVLFNNDLYRIIGVFDDNSHGVTGQQLVKLIAANKLTAAAWGAYNASPAYTTYSSYKNDWTGTTTGVPASANILLNEFYLNPTATSTYGECIDWTYGSNNNTDKSKNCSNIKGYGVQSNELRNYIQPVTWYLYGYTANTLSKQNFYQCERNNYSGCTSANSGTYSGTTTASIGLMYVSDYMYASGYIASNDTSTTASNTNLMNLNWLHNGYEWTITPRGDSSTNAFVVYNTGGVSYLSSYSGHGLRPTFYLKSTIKIKSGDGTFKNPYTIG